MSDKKRPTECDKCKPHFNLALQTEARHEAAIYGPRAAQQLVDERLATIHEDHSMSCCESEHRGIGHGGHECDSQRPDPDSLLPWYCTRPVDHEGIHEAWGVEPDTPQRKWSDSDSAVSLVSDGGSET